MISPAISLFCVRALNCLQNSMMLTCAWPSAGPTGGAGGALPASICNLTIALTFFGGAMSRFLRNQLSAPSYQLQPVLFFVQFWCCKFSVRSQPVPARLAFQLEAES